ncbi:chorismate mutase [Vespertiliibacter pulmonis]|uniref:Bifunctional chorismate mutase/prephenate dehydratase n=1 Tax=Vespertiliibacter pulmonis TaxID=1443036 RepID=A0A3N4VKX6_9PAST|nr:chorismate mutase [Vespertiliibacter pulmonis]QLB21153.1 chorismate mutase [Vespertiliibacter pulmonis]RPE83742.1 chorismate mutase [Vespertiliibacter pulmonis]
MSLDLSEIRQQITQIDRHLLKLLSQRHNLAFDVVRSKEINQKPLRDIDREKALLLELVNFAEAENYQLDPQYITQIFQRIIEDSVLTQQAYLQNKLNTVKPQISVAFLGMRGSYSHLASRQFTKKQANGFRELSCCSFNEVFEKVQNGEADYGVLPLENTTSGSINEVYDLLQHTDLTLVGELAYPIKHCLLGTQSIKLDEIDTIYTHSQPAQQCNQFLNSLDKVHIKYCESSSHAMEMVSRLNEPNIVALGNEEGGKLYGLNVLQSDIANQQHNLTRFIVVAKESVQVSPQVQTKTLLLMTTSQQAGALVDALIVFKQFGIRMIKLESRPIYGKPWEEMFYVELEANIHQESTQKALVNLEQVASYLKVLGCYPSEIIEPVKL